MSTRAKRRVAAKAGLVLDVLGLLALGCAVLAGAVSSGSATGLAVTLAIGLAGEITYLCCTRSRP